MKKFSLQITILIAIATIAASCSVEKRHYRPGFHVQAAQKKTVRPEVKTTPAKVEEPTENAQATPVEETAPQANVDVTASTDKAEAVPVAAKEHVVTTKPSKKAQAATIKIKGNKNIANDPYAKKAYKASPKGLLGTLGDDKIIAILLCIFLGALGIHRFYLGYPLSAVIMILLFLASVIVGGFIFGWFGYIAGVALFVWIIVDLIYLIMDKPLFFQK